MNITIIIVIIIYKSILDIPVIEKSSYVHDLQI